MKNQLFYTGTFLALASFLLMSCEAPKEEDSGPPNPNSVDVSFFTTFLAEVSDGIETSVLDDGSNLTPNEQAKQAIATALGDLALFYEDLEKEGWANSEGNLVYEAPTPRLRRWTIKPVESGYQAVLLVDYNGDGSLTDADYADDATRAFADLIGKINDYEVFQAKLYHPDIGAEVFFSARPGNENDDASLTFNGEAPDGSVIDVGISAAQDGSSGQFAGSFNDEAVPIEFFLYRW